MGPPLRGRIQMQSKFSQAKAHRFPFSFHQMRWSLVFLWFVFDPHVSSFPTIHPPGAHKASPSNKCSRCLSGPSVRLLRREDSRRGAGKQLGQWGVKKKEEKRWGEKRREVKRRACDFTHPGGLCSPRLSVPYLQKALFRDSPNEHSWPHSSRQWSPPLPLSLLTMENIAPIKPQRQ